MLIFCAKYLNAIAISWREEHLARIIPKWLWTAQWSWGFSIWPKKVFRIPFGTPPRVPTANTEPPVNGNLFTRTKTCRQSPSQLLFVPFPARGHLCSTANCLCRSQLFQILSDAITMSYEFAKNNCFKRSTQIPVASSFKWSWMSCQRSKSKNETGENAI